MRSRHTKRVIAICARVNGYHRQPRQVASTLEPRSRITILITSALLSTNDEPIATSDDCALLPIGTRGPPCRRATRRAAQRRPLAGGGAHLDLRLRHAHGDPVVRV